MWSSGRIVRGSAAALAVIATAACAKKDAGSGDTTAATSTASGTTAATTSSGGGMTQRQRDDVHTAIREYRLTEENVNKTIQALQKLQALQKSNPQVATAMEQEHSSPGEAKSIDEMVSRLDAIAPAKAVLSSVGLSTRDYVLTTFELMEAGAAYQFQKMGKLPANSQLARDVSPENLAYIGSHQQQMQALERATGSGSADSGGE